VVRVIPSHQVHQEGHCEGWWRGFVHGPCCYDARSGQSEAHCAGSKFVY
jgi:hypothetical protein